MSTPEEFKARDSFGVQLLVHLIFGYIGWPLWIVGILSPFLQFFIGIGVDYGVMRIDITTNGLRKGMETPRFRDGCVELYKLATSKVHSEEEKQAIREQYLATAKYLKFGNGLRNG